MSKCLDCGMPYSEMGLDFCIPDKQWNYIVPEENGILCANCFCKRARKFGGTAILAWVDNVNYNI